MAGGKSLRMGADKGLLLNKSGEIWATSAWNKLNSCGIRSFVSLNPEQTTDYSGHFNPENIIIDLPEINAAGPIKGILSAHHSFPMEAILVLACDLPNMEISCLKELMEFQKIKPESLAWVYQNGVQIEPMCAIYSSQGLAQIAELLAKNELTKTSLISTLDRLQAAIKPVSEENSAYFLNCNSPQEIS